MNEHDIAEVAFNNGYEKGYADGKYKVMNEIAFPRFLVRQTELSKKDVEDILMQSPTIIMDKTEIIPIYPYRWIPVSERLPEVGQRILVYCESKTIKMHVTTCTYMAGRFGSKQFSRHVRNVTHWMPLPEPPKEDA